MKKYKIKKILIKKFYIINFLLLSLMINNFSYAKSASPYAGEVDKPVAETKNNVSDGVIYHKDAYEEYSPLNPVPIGVNKEEYDSVDNFNVSFDTLETRIKYFSPTYKNHKASAESSLWMAFYIRGGDLQIMNNYKDLNGDLIDEANSYKALKEQYISDLNRLDKKSSTYETDYSRIKGMIDFAEGYYKTIMGTYSYSNKMATYMMSKAGYRKALSRVANVDNNNSLTYARQVIVKNAKSAIMSYLQLEKYVDMLTKQQELYKEMYELSMSNYNLEIATALDVSKSLTDYENVKTTLNATRNTMRKVKLQIAALLGYKNDDVDKLVFEEPEIDMDYIEKINIDEDRDRAYNSNTAYKSISLDEEAKIYPGSTGEELYNKRRQYVAEKIVVALEQIHSDLKAKKLAYQSNSYLSQICEINKQANKRKLDNNLISKLEYDALELQNIANEFSIKVAEYDLINAANNYYYGVLGNITIS